MYITISLALANGYIAFKITYYHTSEADILCA